MLCLLPHKYCARRQKTEMISVWFKGCVWKKGEEMCKYIDFTDSLTWRESRRKSR